MPNLPRFSIKHYKLSTYKWRRGESNPYLRDATAPCSRYTTPPRVWPDDYIESKVADNAIFALSLKNLNFEATAKKSRTTAKTHYFLTLAST